jgi:hypothetical protein
MTRKLIIEVVLSKNLSPEYIQWTGNEPPVLSGPGAFLFNSIQAVQNPRFQGYRNPSAYYSSGSSFDYPTKARGPDEVYTTNQDPGTIRTRGGYNGPRAGFEGERGGYQGMRGGANPRPVL